MLYSAAAAAAAASSSSFFFFWFSRPSTMCMSCHVKSEEIEQRGTRVLSQQKDHETSDHKNKERVVSEYNKSVSLVPGVPGTWGIH